MRNRISKRSKSRISRRRSDRRSHRRSRRILRRRSDRRSDRSSHFQKRYRKKSYKKNMRGGSLPLFIVYGRLSCPYTREALDTLKTGNQTNSFFDVDDSKNFKRLQDLKDNGRVPKDYQTVPVILRSNKFIGGMSELSKLNL